MGKIKEWLRIPENWTSLIIGGGALYVLYLALPTLTEFLTRLLIFVGTGIKLAALIAVATFLAYALWDNRMALFYFYKGICRILTRLMITYDPVGTIETNVERMKEMVESLAQAIKKVKGSIQKLAGIIEQRESERDRAYALAREAEKRDMKAQQTTKLVIAGRRAKVIVKYEKMRNMLELAYRLLMKYREVADAKVELAEDDLNLLREQFEVSKIYVQAARSAWALLKGNAKEQDLKEAAAREIEGRYAAAVGDLESVMDMARDVIETADLDNMAVAEEALVKFEAWKQRADTFLTEEEKTALVHASEDPGNVLDMDGHHTTTPRVKTRDQGYGDLFRPRTS